MSRDGGGVVGCPPSPKFGQLRFFGQGEEFGQSQVRTCVCACFFLFQERYFSFCICNRVGQRTIKDIIFTRIFKVSTKLPESRSDKSNLENFENTSEINP